MEREKLIELIGPVAIGDYDDTREWDRPDLERWALKLRGLSDQELIAETHSAVNDSALANHLRMPWDASHCRSSACYFEARRRHRISGHASDCRGDTLYTAGYNRAFAGSGFGYDSSDPSPCTCSKDGGDMSRPSTGTKER